MGRGKRPVNIECSFGAQLLPLPAPTVANDPITPRRDFLPGPQPLRAVCSGLQPDLQQHLCPAALHRAVPGGLRVRRGLRVQRR